jgi:hypothetical protein
MTDVKTQQPLEEKMISTEHIDHKTPSIAEGEKDAVVHRELDKFGSWAKSDSREIALVKKLDWYIMVCPPIAKSVD